MRTFGKFLAFGAGVGALIAAAAANVAARVQPEPFAPTPRKPNFRPTRKIASRGRAEARMQAKERFYKQLSKEREIGVDPIHLHGSSLRKDAMRPAWLKKSREWDQRNAGGPSRV